MSDPVVNYDALQGILTVLIDMPATVDGFVTPNADGTYTIFLARNRSEARIKKALQHELEHIRRGDLFSGEDVQAIEARAHKEEV